MMELLLEVGIAVVVLTLLVGGLAVWRIGQVVSWRALAMTARATRSFTEGVAYIRFCAEERACMDADRSLGQQESPPQGGPGHVLREWPHVS